MDEQNNECDKYIRITNYTSICNHEFTWERSYRVILQRPRPGINQKSQLKHVIGDFNAEEMGNYGVRNGKGETSVVYTVPGHVYFEYIIQEKSEQELNLEDPNGSIKSEID